MSRERRLQQDSSCQTEDSDEERNSGVVTVAARGAPVRPAPAVGVVDLVSRGTQTAAALYSSERVSGQQPVRGDRWRYQLNLPTADVLDVEPDVMKVYSHGEGALPEWATIHWDPPPPGMRWVRAGRHSVHHVATTGAGGVHGLDRIRSYSAILRGVNEAEGADSGPPSPGEGPSDRRTRATGDERNPADDEAQESRASSVLAEAISSGEEVSADGLVEDGRLVIRQVPVSSSEEEEDGV